MAKPITFTATIEFADTAPLTFKFSARSHHLIAEQLEEFLDAALEVVPRCSMRVTFLTPDRLTLELPTTTQMGFRGLANSIEAELCGRLMEDVGKAVAAAGRWTRDPTARCMEMLSWVDQALTDQLKNQKKSLARLAVCHQELARHNREWIRLGWDEAAAD